MRTTWSFNLAHSAAVQMSISARFLVNGSHTASFAARNLARLDLTKKPLMPGTVAWSTTTNSVT